MLALHGFDAYGVEVSEKGAEVAREYVASELAEPGEANFGEKDKWPDGQTGDAKIIAGDFFLRDWEDVCADGAAGFDVIYDYTVRRIALNGNPFPPFMPGHKTKKRNLLTLSV